MTDSGEERLPLLRGPSGVETARPVSMALSVSVGHLLRDRWRVVRGIGRGGFGAVYAAEDLVLGQEIAVKILDPRLSCRREALKQFRREVGLLCGLAHERIVRVFHYDEELAQSLAWFTMELVQGTSVAEVIARIREAGGGGDPLLCCKILQQSLEGLAAAHERGIVHSDISPANILLSSAKAHELVAGTAAPAVKLVDFGIASLVGQAELAERSLAHGTAPYMAPEVLAGEPVPTELRPAADIFSLGAVVYELLTGSRAVSHYDREPDGGAEIPRPIRWLLERMLESVPERRPGAAVALSESRRVVQQLESCRWVAPRAVRERPGRLQRRLEHAMDEDDLLRVRALLDQLKEILGPAVDDWPVIGIAEAWLLSHE